MLSSPLFSVCYSTLILLLLSLSITAPSVPVSATALDDYVWAPDPTFDYVLEDTIDGAGFKILVVNLTSQTWMSRAVSDTPVWDHYLLICVPDEPVDTNIGFLWMDGGSDPLDYSPTSLELPIQILCMTSNTVVAELHQIPNEPIVFVGDHGIKRSEDAFIAYTWMKFINDTSVPDILARLPMTKAAIMAMDAVEDIVATLPGVTNVDKFVVAGASKRGWTTWTTAAVNPERVIAFAPLVIPVLNMSAVIGEEWQAYGNWSFALDDYVDVGVLKYLNSPQMADLSAIVDPINYLSNLTQPKLIVDACGDEFTLPDSPKHFYKDLLGESHLRMVPNAEHSLAGHELDVTATLQSFYHSILYNSSRPKFTWEISSNGTQIVVDTSMSPIAPRKAVLWFSTVPDARDWRFIVCDGVTETRDGGDASRDGAGGDDDGENQSSSTSTSLPPMYMTPGRTPDHGHEMVKDAALRLSERLDSIPSDCIKTRFWFGETLHPMADGTTYVANMDVPPLGWTGFFVEFEFDVDPLNIIDPMKLTTEVSIIPKTYPYPPCTDSCTPPNQ